MSIPSEFIVPYILSNVIALVLLILAWKLPRIARLLFFLLFAWAGWANTNAVLSDPGQYLNYSEFAFFDFYKDFILGFFSVHTKIIVLSIAFCQLLISISMLLKGSIFKLGCIGACIFFVGIAPLGVGAAFPSSLIGVMAIIFMNKRTGNNFLWKPENFQ